MLFLNKTMRFYFLVLAQLVYSLGGDAQDFNVRGRVTDHEGKPLLGVNVRLKDGMVGTQTNEKGEYTLKVNNRNVVLVFSFLSYTTQEVKLGTNMTLDVVLQEADAKLEEVVVVAYGSVKREDLTGSVAELRVDDVRKAPVGAFTEAMAGRLAGVRVSSNEGQPGTLPEITIRGVGSLTQSSAPLYVVDGSPIENFNAGSVNTADIASVTILKDASATALYGARAANGVVVIETKKGTEGKAQVNFDANAGIQNVRKYIDVMNPYEFVKYQVEILPSLGPNMYYRDGRDLEYYRDIKGVDWQRDLLNTGRHQKYELSVRGGTKETKYAVSGAIYDQKGIIVNTNAKRYNGQISLEHSFNEKLKGAVTYSSAQTKVGGMQASLDNAGYRNFVFYSAWGYRPVSENDDIDLSDVNVDDAFNPSNPSDIRVNPVKNFSNIHRLSSTLVNSLNGNLSYKITPALTFTTRGNLITSGLDFEEFYNSKTARGNLKNPLNSKGIQAAVNTTNVTTWSNDNTLAYVKRFNRVHHLSALGGFSLYSSERKQHGVGYMNIPDEELGMSGVDGGKVDATTASRNNFSLMSYFGRFGYNYKSKYIFTGTIRADGSSKFEKNNRWGYFPSAALAWNMKQESFLKNIKAITNSKLRFSFGTTGNNRIGEFDKWPRLDLSYVAAYSFENEMPIDGLVMSELGNKDLRWETTYQTDIGYDLSLFNNRLSITADVYRKDTKDLLIYADMPATTGFTRVYKNVGSLRNQGLELTLNTVNIKTTNFLWESDFNISFNKNRIQSLNSNQTDMFHLIPFEASFKEALNVSSVGHAAGDFYGYLWDGNYQYSDFDEVSPGIYKLKDGISNNGAARDLIQPGDIKYVDVNNDGAVNSEDKVHMGSGLPTHFGGFGNRVSYKNFDLNVFFQWSYGNKVFNANRVVLEGNTNGIAHLNQYATYANRWTPENQSNSLYRTNGQGPPGMYSNRTLESGSYLRLKTVSLGYKLPTSIVQRINMKDLKIVLSAQNLFTFTKYSGMDPEVSTRGNGIQAPGFDYSAYPQARTIVAGISASF